jgi:putative Holliday junction resolvase
MPSVVVGQDSSERGEAGKALKANPRKAVCALDLGAVRVGVAITDELGLMAHPRGVLAFRPRPLFLEALRELVEAEQVGRIIVGFPLDMRGTEGEAARRARDTAQAIADATKCDVELFDERLTTVQAQRSLTASGVTGRKARAHIDEASAVAILQAWLDARAERRAERRAAKRGSR